jgi:hypothetical protein
MEDLSLIAFILVCLPEKLIMTFFGFALIGKFNFFKSQSNIIRLLLFSIVITMSTYFLIKVLGFRIENTLISMMLHTLLLILIVRTKFYESILASIFGGLLIFVTEIPIIFALSFITSIDTQDLYSNAENLLIFLVPERIIQISLIYISFILKFKIVDMETTNINRKEYYIQLATYLISILILLILSFIMTKALVFDDYSDMNYTNSFLMKINICITLFATIILTLAIKGTHNYYKNKRILDNNEVIQSIEYIYNLLEEKDYEEAKESLVSLKTHIEK